jgi:hypothetical protein
MTADDLSDVRRSLGLSQAAPGGSRVMDAHLCLRCGQHDRELPGHYCLRCRRWLASHGASLTPLPPKSLPSAESEAALPGTNGSGISEASARLVRGLGEPVDRTTAEPLIKGPERRCHWCRRRDRGGLLDEDGDPICQRCYDLPGPRERNA